MRNEIHCVTGEKTDVVLVREIIVGLSCMVGHVGQKGKEDSVGEVGWPDGVGAANGVGLANGVVVAIRVGVPDGVGLPDGVGV